MEELDPAPPPPPPPPPPPETATTGNVEMQQQRESIDASHHSDNEVVMTDTDSVSAEGAAVVAKNPPRASCCNDIDKHFKPLHKAMGGLQSATGESGLDGTGTTAKAHEFIQLLTKYCNLDIDSTYMDCGASLGLHATHVALLTGAMTVGVESNKERYTQSMVGLSKLGVQVTIIYAFLLIRLSLFPTNLTIQISKQQLDMLPTSHFSLCLVL